MKVVAKIAMMYTVFAAISGSINIGGQAIIIWLYQGPFAIPLSVLVGTVTGLPIKYVLEKRHIFDFKSENLMHDGRLFMLYTIMSVFTTVLFWGSEYVFHHIFGTNVMRYLGGAVGLSLGYLTKYHLDKRFVFVNRNTANLTGTL